MGLPLKSAIAVLVLELVVSSVEICIDHKVIDNSLRAAIAYRAGNKPNVETYETTAKCWMKRRNQVGQFSRYLPFHAIQSAINKS